MRRYIALSWHHEIAARRETAQSVLRQIRAAFPEWNDVADLPGLRVLCTPDRSLQDEVTVLPNRTGVVLGELFERRADPLDDSPCPRARLGLECREQLVSSRGRYLVERYWGNYVAFITESGGRNTWTLRSPLGHLPCFIAEFRGIRLAFSRIDDILRLGILRFSVNWEYVAAFVAHGAVRSAETGLLEVRELQLGTCIDLNAAAPTVVSYWNPCAIAAGNPLHDEAHATKQLCSQVRSSVRTRATMHESIIHRLSGGIDSSIVLSCLKDMPRTRTNCINFHNSGAFGDERHFARAMANKAGQRLWEFERDPQIRLREVISAVATTSPMAYFTHFGYNPVETKVAQELGATGIFTGIMGDMLFQMRPASAVAAEFVQRQGIRPALIPIAYYAAQIDRTSIWHTLRIACRDGWFHKPKGDLTPAEFALRAVLLTSDAHEELKRNWRRFTHPWLQEVSGVPVGKLPLITALAFDSMYFDPCEPPGSPEMIHPLLGEPLVETSLCIPSYYLLKDGWDRAMARRVFAKELPEIVLARSTKGSPERWLKGVVARDPEFLRELLLDGLLVQNGILDRGRLADALPGVASNSASYICDVVEYACAEAWLRVWSHASLTAVAA